MMKRHLFSASEVEALRKTYADTKVSLAQLARRHKVSASTIGNIIRGDTYFHVGGPTSVRPIDRPKDPMAMSRGRQRAKEEAKEEGIPISYHTESSLTVGTLVQIRGQAVVMTIDGIQDLASRGLVHVSYFDARGQLMGATLLGSILEVVG